MSNLAIRSCREPIPEESGDIDSVLWNSRGFLIFWMVMVACFALTFVGIFLLEGSYQSVGRLLAEVFGPLTAVLFLGFFSYFLFSKHFMVHLRRSADFAGQQRTDRELKVFAWGMRGTFLLMILAAIAMLISEFVDPEIGRAALDVLQIAIPAAVGIGFIVSFWQAFRALKRGKKHDGGMKPGMPSDPRE